MHGSTNARRIAPEEAEAYRIAGGRPDAGLVILCDHATNYVPSEYGRLGLSEQQFSRHIAYDIGAEPIAFAIGSALDVPVVASKFSRLLIDPNRGSDDPTLVMRLSDGAVVPGNRYVDESEIERRRTRFWRPYHAAVTRTLESCGASGSQPMLLAIHSMTDVWRGVARPWPVAILWDEEDDRLARPLLEGFRADSSLLVGDNEPYHGCLEGDTLWQHGRANGLAGAIIEYRQDLVAGEAGQRDWAGRTVAILAPILQSARERSTSKAKAG